MKSPWTVVVAVVALSASSAFSSRTWAQVIKVGLEVTQGIQYFEHATYGSNTIDLVAGRLTAVRARIDGVPAGKCVKTINAALAIDLVPGPTPSPGPEASSPLNPEEVVDFLNGRAPWDRTKIDNTLNFVVSSLSKGQWKFTVKVELTLIDPSTNAVSVVNAVGDATLNAIAIRPVEFRLVPMEFKAANGKTYEPRELDPLEDGIDLIQGCLPLPDETLAPWQSPMTLPRRDNRACPGRIDDAGRKSEVNEVLNDLGAMAVSTVRAGTVSTELFYYGFAQPRVGQVTLIADGFCMDILGWASCQARAAFGTASLEASPAVLAHEFGHFLGLNHCGSNCRVSGSCSLETNVGLDVRTMTTRPPLEYTSLMTCGVVRNNAVWMTPEDYKFALDVLEVGSTVTPCGAPGPQPDPPAAWSLVVRGGVSADGEHIEWVDNVFRYPWKVPSTPPGAKGPYEIRITNGSQTVVRRLDARMHLEYVNRGAGVQVGFFSIVIPFPEKPFKLPPLDLGKLPPNQMENVEKLTIWKGPNNLFTMERSQTPPIITILAPPNPAISKQKPPVSIHWDTTPATGLLHELVYSHDGGQSFEPVAVNLRTGTAIFDPRNFLSSGPEQGVLRILVTDGLNTVYKDIDSLTVE